MLVFLFKYSKQNKIKAVENKAIQGSMTSQELREKLNKQNHKIYTTNKGQKSKIIYHCHKIKYEIKPIREGNSFYVYFIYDKQLLNDKWYLKGEGEENQKYRKYSIGKTFYHYTNNHSDYKIKFEGDWFLK
ncbi:hypothetical protein C6B37_01625 [Candidatus Phytoplasma phoenicium]|uniref:Uncharacterized protein n=1 Tax=Candidatus Phytoplasma phoenicium TaxID=198422 RepID=A0A2S8NU69_9MOLU|nr:hypothetical protein C6B37_01625 [Candidatus Phytoplasma phoenicium]